MMTRTAATAPAARQEFPLKAVFFAAVVRILAADRRYREAQKLRRMPDFRLQDMGLSRRDADTAFLRKQP